MPSWRAAFSPSGCRRAPPSPACAAPCWRADQKAGHDPRPPSVDCRAGAALARRPGLRAAGPATRLAALPLYVVLPHCYASDLGLPLATVGALLMLVRLMDAGAEPLLGRLSDRLYRRTARRPCCGWPGLRRCCWRWAWRALFFPRVQGQAALAVWMVAGLLFTCLAHSLLVIAHQAWGVRLGGDALQRSRIVAWREGAGAAGRGHGQRAVGGLGRGQYVGRVCAGTAGRLAGAVARAAPASAAAALRDRRARDPVLRCGSHWPNRHSAACWPCFCATASPAPYRPR